MTPRTNPPLYILPLFRHLWIVFVVVGVVNILLTRWQWRQKLAERPDLEPTFKRYLAILAIYLTPWLVMGFAIEMGGVPNMFSFLRLSDRNPYIISFYGVLTVLLAVACYWICLRGGAEFLAEQPRPWRRSPSSPAGIRVSYALVAVGWLVFLVLRWLNLLPNLLI